MRECVCIHPRMLARVSLRDSLYASLSFPVRRGVRGFFKLAREIYLCKTNSLNIL